MPIINLREEDVADAKRLTVAQKLALGGDLFDMACEVMVSGIRMQNPSFGPHEIRVEVERRLALARLLESRA